MKKVNTDEMVVKVEMKFKDLLAYTANNYYRKVGTKIWMGISVASLVILSYTLLSYYNKYGKLNNNFLNTCTGIFILFVVGPPIFICYNCKSLIDKDELIKKEYVYTFSDRGIKITSDVSKNMIKWSSISRVIGNKRIIEIYASRNQGLIIPIRFLDRENNEPEILKEILKKYVHEEKLKLK
ncbi:YcxB family protein [Clostridium akagii]|uniref:YcxB family protein n=1 Tax=Clostridium akagii TaxID=91623 RepID=UPI00047ED080|nr:YcxB family protein [Clostridium akagii]